MNDEQIVQLIVVFQSSVDEGRMLLEANPDLIEARTSLGETPLHFLCVENHIDAVRELVRLGAAVNTVNDVATTPLTDAASLGYVELVRFLLEAGASLWLEGQRDPTLHEAVRGGSVEIVKLLLDARAPVDEQDDLSETPLHVAVADDRVEIASLLLSHGANPVRKGIFDRTALEIAREAGSEMCIALLSSKH
jgi:ankyrin repeat protein